MYSERRRPFLSCHLDPRPKHGREGGREGEIESEREDTDLLSLNISNLNRKITKVHYLNVGDILECAVE